MTQQRDPIPTRTKRGLGSGATLDLTVQLYRAPDGMGNDFGAFVGRDAKGRWELHFASPVERERQYARIERALLEVATQAREDEEEDATAERSVWLKTIGFTGSPPPNDWWEDGEREHGVDFPYRPRSIKVGDLLVIYAVGSGHVVGVAEVVSDPGPGPQERWPWRVRINILKRKSVDQGFPLEELDDERQLSKSLRQKSYVRLTETEAANALRTFGLE